MELAFLAGVLEGEGSFSTKPRVYLGMTDIDIVIRFVRFFELPWGCIGARQPKRPNSKIEYTAAIYGDNARRVMAAVLPFMGNRRSARIREVLNG